MEFEFDKEIDAILRKARESEYAFAVGNQQFHLDADEISAFAENALPEKAKHLYTKHFAVCDRCRRILSNIILLNSEAENVPAFVVAEEKITAPTAPWYQRLFVFPNLAYSLGALVLVFGGLIGFTLLQSFNNADISQVSNSNKTFESKSAPVSASNTTSSNMTNAMTANSAMNANSASVYSANTTANSATISNSNVSKPNASPTAIPRTEDEIALGKVQQETKPIGTDNKDAVMQQNVPQAMEKKEDNRNKVADSETARGQSSTSREDSQVQKPKLKTSAPTTGEAVTISGKTFNRRNNVWYDSAYNNQVTVNITRGSNEYEKLDSDLRQTVERLGGTVVIVWKSKAYRIQ